METTSFLCDGAVERSHTNKHRQRVAPRCGPLGAIEAQRLISPAPARIKGLTKTLRIVDRWLDRNQHRGAAIVGPAQRFRCALYELIPNPDAKSTLQTKMAKAKDDFEQALARENSNGAHDDQ